MRRVKGIYEGQGVFLVGDVELAPKTEVEMIPPEVGTRPLAEFLDRLSKLPPLAPDDVLTDQEILALVHEVRAERECGS